MDLVKPYTWTKWLDFMRSYVQRKLLTSGVIPKYAADPLDPDGLVTHIISEAMRQPTVDFLDGRGMPCIKWADDLIERAIKSPPNPIDKKHFSLSTFIKEKEGQL